MIIREYTKERIPDVLDFERRLREEESFWGWEIDEAYVESVTRSFDSPAEISLRHSGSFRYASSCASSAHSQSDCVRFGLNF